MNNKPINSKFFKKIDVECDCFKPLTQKQFESGEQGSIYVPHIMGEYLGTPLKKCPNFMDEYKSGNKNFNKMREDAKGHKIEETGAKLRAMMPWIGKNKLVNQENN
jgi:hypothetical protein